MEGWGKLRTANGGHRMGRSNWFNALCSALGRAERQRQLGAVGSGASCRIAGEDEGVFDVVDFDVLGGENDADDVEAEGVTGTLETRHPNLC